MPPSTWSSTCSASRSRASGATSFPSTTPTAACISAGNEIVTRTIPGTDISLNNVLGLDSLLQLGTYIRHYLRPQLDETGFTRDPAIPLGNGTSEGGTNYYGPSGPTLGGFFEYLQANWIPTLGGQAGGLTWQTITSGSEIVGITVTSLPRISPSSASSVSISAKRWKPSV